MIGIYKITNRINGKSYIGCSENIEHRWAIHKYRAFANTPKNKEYQKALYRAFRKYGINNFDFTILELCKKEEIHEKEKEFICRYNTYKNGYNETPGGEGVKNVGGENHPKTKLTNEDVYYIRECYNNHMERDEVYQFFRDRIGLSGFKKIWNGYTWPKIHMDVYTKENKDFFIFQRNSKGGQKANAKLTPEQVLNIRMRKKKGEPKEEVYKMYSFLTYGSFKCVWYNNCWKNIKVD